MNQETLRQYLARKTAEEMRARVARSAPMQKFDEDQVVSSVIEEFMTFLDGSIDHLELYEENLLEIFTSPEHKPLSRESLVLLDQIYPNFIGSVIMRNLPSLL